METTYRENFTQQLQELLSLLADGKEGYQKAAQETDNSELKLLFNKFSHSRESLAKELGAKIAELGGNPVTRPGTLLGRFHRHWLDLKTALSSNDDQMILETCRNGDRAVLDAYDDILQGAILETALKPLLMNQRIDIHQEFIEIDKRYFQLFKIA